MFNLFSFLRRLKANDAVRKLIEYIFDIFNKKEIAVNIFIDFQKEFDTINHLIFIRELEFYGLRGLTLKLIKNYLQNRFHVIKIGSYNSSLRSVTMRIP